MNIRLLILGHFHAVLKNRRNRGIGSVGIG